MLAGRLVNTGDLAYKTKMQQSTFIPEFPTRRRQEQATEVLPLTTTY